MFKLKKRGALFYVHFTDAQGNRQRLSTGETVEAQATAKAFDIVRKHLAGEAANARDAAAPAGPLIAGEVNVAAALNEALATVWEGQRSLDNRNSHIKEIINDIGYLPIGQLDYNRLVEYGKVLAARGNSPATRNRKFSTLQVALKQQVKRGRLHSMPEFPKYKEADFKERYLSDEEEERILRVIDADDDGRARYFRHLFVFLIETGCRCTEAMTIKPVQDLGTQVHLPHGSTKNGKGRLVPLTTRAREALTAMLASRHHGKFNVDWATRRYRKAADACGLEDTVLHTLRHTAASRIVQSCRDIYAAMHWLGHSSVEVTRRYAHLVPDAPLMNALAALEARRATTVPNSQSTIAEQEGTLPRLAQFPVGKLSQFNGLGDSAQVSNTHRNPNGDK